MKKGILIICSIFIIVGCDIKEEKDIKGKNNTSEYKKLESNQDDSNSELKNDEVTISNQVWMAKNLNVDKFRNGDAIPEAKSEEEWNEAGKNKQPAWCYYDNDPANGEKYGKLYNWYAVNDPRGLSPIGWHVPNEEEWVEIENQFIDTNNTNGILTIIGGYRNVDGKFTRVEECAGWWSTTESNENFAIGRSSWANSNRLGILNDDINYGSKEVGLSVRCLRD